MVKIFVSGLISVFFAIRIAAGIADPIQSACVFLLSWIVIGVVVGFVLGLFFRPRMYNR